MIHPPIDELLKQVPSKYALVIIASKRARQINAYHHQLGEGEFDESYAPPQIESRSKNYLTMALEELAAGRSSGRTRQQPEADGPRAAASARRNGRHRRLPGV